MILVDTSLDTMLSANNSTNLTVEDIDSFLNATFYNAIHVFNSTSLNTTDEVGFNDTVANMTDGISMNGTNATEDDSTPAIDIASLAEYIRAYGPFDRTVLAGALDSLLVGMADSVGFSNEIFGLPSGAELLNLVDSVISQPNETTSSSDATNALAIASTIVLRETLKDVSKEWEVVEAARANP